MSTTYFRHYGALGAAQERLPFKAPLSPVTTVQFRQGYIKKVLDELVGQGESANALWKTVFWGPAAQKPAPAITVPVHTHIHSSTLKKLKAIIERQSSEPLPRIFVMNTKAQVVSAGKSCIERGPETINLGTNPVQIDEGCAQVRGGQLDLPALKGWQQLAASGRAGYGQKMGENLLQALDQEIYLAENKEASGWYKGKPYIPPQPYAASSAPAATGDQPDPLIVTAPKKVEPQPTAKAQAESKVQTVSAGSDKSFWEKHKVILIGGGVLLGLLLLRRA